MEDWWNIIKRKRRDKPSGWTPMPPPYINTKKLEEVKAKKEEAKTKKEEAERRRKEYLASPQYKKDLERKREQEERDKKKRALQRKYGIISCRNCGMESIPTPEWVAGNEVDGYGDKPYECDTCGKILRERESYSIVESPDGGPTDPLDRYR